MNFRRAIGGGTLALAVLASSAARAALVEEIISFTNTGSYAAFGGPWNPTVAAATITGKVDVFVETDPNKYAGAVTGKLLSLTMPSGFSQSGSVSFTSGYDQLTFGTFANNGQQKNSNFGGNSDFIVNISGITGSKLSSTIYFSAPGQREFTSSGGTVTVSTVPLPAALPLFGAALLGMGGMAHRRTKKAA